MLQICKLTFKFQAHLINIAFLGISFFISLLLFQHGFLLKRVELTARSSCLDVVSREACWLPAQYQRLIIILIDALRYDFVIPPGNISNTFAYSGHMPTITRLLSDYNGECILGLFNTKLFQLTLFLEKTVSFIRLKLIDSAVLMQFKADPPTTTMQRLKALTTGSLPTFIDISSNFASTAVMEDNWIDQIVRTNRSIVMLGDDTWYFSE